MPELRLISDVDGTTLPPEVEILPNVVGVPRDVSPTIVPLTVVPSPVVETVVLAVCDDITRDADVVVDDVVKGHCIQPAQNQTSQAVCHPPPNVEQMSDAQCAVEVVVVVHS